MWRSFCASRMAVRVFAAFGNRSARRRAPLPLLFVPPRLVSNQHLGSSRHELSQSAPTRQAFTSQTTVAEPRGYGHSDLLADGPQSEPSPDFPCCRLPPPAPPSLLPRSIDSFSALPSYLTFQQSLDIIFTIYFASLRELRAPWLA